MIKLSIWNVLTALVLLLAGGVGSVYAMVYVEPEIPINPFPPPTQAVLAQIDLPTATVEHQEMPPTWTTGPSMEPGQVNLKPSSTPQPTNTQVFLPTFTGTATKTKTPTVTATKTLTPTKNLTQTKEALLLTYQAKTDQAKSKTPTVTKTPYPDNPTIAVELVKGTTTNTWQNDNPDPEFSWNPVSGAIGYYIYWGTDPNGVVSTYNNVVTYDPPAVTPGAVYYLRLRTKFSTGPHPYWSTVFIFKYDNSTPTNPVGLATETAAGTTNDTWQNTNSNPAFTWSAGSDSYSDISYDVYWGTDSGGTTVVDTVTSAAYDPAAVTTGTYYLRVNTKDQAGNEAGWITLFTFKYDNTGPTNPDTVTETAAGTADDTWQNTNSDPAFTWSGESDPHSGVASFDVYWGTDPNGTTVTTNTASGAYDPGAESTGTYYLRVNTKDTLGNEAGWDTIFTFKYDLVNPTDPANTAEDGNPSSYTTPHFTWDASTDADSGLAAYEIYWAIDTVCGSPNQSDVSIEEFTSGVLTVGGDYLFCVRAKDEAGNTSSWDSTTFTFTP